MTAPIDRPEPSVPAAGGEGHARAQDVAEYIAELAAQLAALARTTDLELIAYLLEMARLEASNTVRRLRPLS